MLFLTPGKNTRVLRRRHRAYQYGARGAASARIGHRYKNIPECKELGLHGGKLVLVPPRHIDMTESGLFPLLGMTANRIADHTIQCKITLGGNLASSIIYRVNVPAAPALRRRLTVAGQNGLTEYDMAQVFQKRLQLRRAPFL